MLIFELYTTPTPQKQTEFRRTASGVRAYDPSKMTKTLIQWQISPTAPSEPLRGAISMDLTFYMPIPKHTTRIKRALMLNGTERPITRPDFDNLAYVVTNALKGIVYRDDSQVVRCLIEKYYSDVPKTVIKIMEI